MDKLRSHLTAAKKPQSSPVIAHLKALQLAHQQLSEKVKCKVAMIR